jgi:hypothetical protein
MREVRIPLPELALVAGTRLALGIGIGLLVASRLTAEERQAAGWALVALGGLTTIPLATDILGRRSHRLYAEDDLPTLASFSRT